MRKHFAIALVVLALGAAQTAQAEHPELPLPPAPPEQMGAPVDCDSTLKPSDPNAAVPRDCPTQPEVYGDQPNNKTQPEKGKPQTTEPEGGGRNIDTR